MQRDAYRFRHRRFVVMAHPCRRVSSIWRSFVGLCLERHAVPSIGLAATAVAGDPSLRSFTSYLLANTPAEFWQAVEPADEPDAASARSTFLRNRRFLHGLTGELPRVTGSIGRHSKVTGVISGMLASGELRAHFAAAGEPEVQGVFGAAQRICPEQPGATARPVSARHFDELRSRQDAWSDLVIEVDPTGWSPECLDEFDTILRGLLAANFQPLTAAEYRASFHDFGDGPARELDPGVLVAFAENLVNEVDGDSELVSFLSSSDRSYYIGQYRRQIVTLGRFLVEQGLLPPPRQREPFHVVDIGAGSANWSLAAAAASPSIEVTAVDTNGQLLGFIEGALKQNILRPRCSFHSGQAEQLPCMDTSVDSILCSNAINYMPAELVFREMARVLKHGGRALIGAQTPAYPVLDSFRMLEAGNLGSARDRVGRLLNHLAQRSGLMGRQRWIAYWFDVEFVALAATQGLVVDAAGLRLPQEYGNWGSVPVLSGYILSRPWDPEERQAQVSPAALVGAGAPQLALDAMHRGSAEPACLPDLFRQLAALTGHGAADLVGLSEARGVPVSREVFEHLDRALPLIRTENWTALRDLWADDPLVSQRERLLLSWRLNEAADRATPVPEDQRDIVSGLCRLSNAIRSAQPAPILHAVQAISDLFPTDRHLLSWLSTGQQPHAGGVSPTSTDRNGTLRRIASALGHAAPV